MSLQHLFTCPFCIYGAGIVASGVYTAIKALYHKEPLFFLVSDPKGQGEKKEQIPTEINGIAVKNLSEWSDEIQRNMPDLRLPRNYLVAAPQVHHNAILASLHAMKNMKIKDEQVILVTSALENELMEAYYGSLLGHNTVLNLTEKEQRLREEKSHRQENGTAKLSEVQVFQAKSHMDRLLSGRYTDCARPFYTYPIQVGASLTEQKIVERQDNQGDNISLKNRNYCELTATYHAWKHSRAAYKGLCHYRRVFDISEEQMRQLLKADHLWDVILPYPSIHYPDISIQHCRYVNESDWMAMLQALQEMAPEYWEAYKKYIAAGGHFFYNFNMLIAKAEVFDDYCNFLFTVLERTEELTIPKGAERSDRFAGYLGENLTTIYFIKNRDKCKIAYAGKIWLT